ncbi:MAG: flagellar biosynthetic protein FliO [Acetobacter aceti]|nr:flagellar biosynthetic protein FliO [Acetobacter aceti]
MGFYDTLSVTLALVAVLAMILLSRKGWKIAARFGGARRGSSSLALESSLALDTRRRLSVVTWEGRRFLLLTGGPNDLVVSGIDPLFCVEESET